MRGKRGAKIGRGRLARRDHGNRREGPAGRADAVEPCHPCKVIGTGHCRARRRHQPRPGLKHRAGTETCRHILFRDIEPDARRHPFRRRWFQPHTHDAARGQMLDALDGPGEAGDGGTGEHRRRNPLGAKPDEAATDRGDQRPDADASRGPPAIAQCDCRQRHRDRCGDERAPSCGVGQQEPGRDPRSQHYRQPQGKLIAFRFQPIFQPDRRTAQPRQGDLKRPIGRARGGRG